MSVLGLPNSARQRSDQLFPLQRVQPAMAGLAGGSFSVLAPISAVVLGTHRPLYAFFAGLAIAIGVDVGMAFSEGRSGSGDLTGRGNPYLRGSITWAGTFLGGIVHTLPLLIAHHRSAFTAAIVMVAFELVALAWIRSRFFNTGFLRSFASVALAGAIIVLISATLGTLA
ncbi:VIT family protein [Nonomuraea terrae]|uniref:VIT family protein n=1 Tax=Nonomuraea terrae TaxID=2530383 RepID=A0A4R4YGR5_9ACTN|nr:VIT family protein [Nonomuraea terrae]TDD43099.1 VIT family protein [Nonomuraea terrae]